MFGPKIKIDGELYERCKQRAAELGYSSTEEFVFHILEKELRNQKDMSREEEMETRNRLKGLGYIE